MSHAPGLQTVGDWGGAGAPVVLEQGAQLYGGGTAAGRRVMLPLGREANLNWNYLNSNGRLIVARVRDNGTGIRREADLSSYTTATLSFDYRRDGPDNANDYVTVDVSDDGGSTWTELDRFVGEGNGIEDTTYQSTSYDISAYIAGNTRIRFLSLPTFGKQDIVYFDNVEICVTN